MTVVTRTYLGMESPGQLRGAPKPTGHLSLTLEEHCTTSLYRTLYDLVGREYKWVERTIWSDEALKDYLARPDVSVWVLREDHQLGGYFEIAKHSDASVELAYFGLAPMMIGRGAGKWLLTRAVEEAWRLNPTRVWLHTCTLDHPLALANYLARGFTPFKSETYEYAG